MEQPVLSSDDLAHFAARGYVRVTDALSPDFVARTQTVIWEQLDAKFGVSEHDPTTWRPGGIPLNKDILDAAVGVEMTPRLVAAIDQLLGAEQWRPIKTLGGLLMTMPEPEPQNWERVFHWHFDNDPRTYVGRVDELMLFTYYSSVRPRGGGTLVLAGSPRLVTDYLATGAANIGDKAFLEAQDLATWHTWLAELVRKRPDPARPTATLMEEQVEVHGVPLRIVELTGEPGDAVLCHPALLHAISLNCSAVPRIMRRTNIRRKR